MPTIPLIEIFVRHSADCERQGDLPFLVPLAQVLKPDLPDEVRVDSVTKFPGAAQTATKAR